MLLKMKLVIEYDVYFYKFRGDIGLFRVCTCDLVQALSGDVIVLVHPLPVAFEVDLGGGRRPAAQLDRPVLYDKSILWLQQEHWERLRWCRWIGVRESLCVNVIAALWKKWIWSISGEKTNQKEE